MNGSESRKLKIGDRVRWRDDSSDLGTITETSWAGVTIRWDNRSERAVLHNDMSQVFAVPPTPSD